MQVTGPTVAIPIATISTKCFAGELRLGLWERYRVLFRLKGG
jgi:hypothetical protein